MSIHSPLSCLISLYNLCIFIPAFPIFSFSILFVLSFFLSSFLGVGQLGVVVYHDLVWVRAAVAKPVEKAAETPAQCAPSRHLVSSHGKRYIQWNQLSTYSCGWGDSVRPLCWVTECSLYIFEQSFCSFLHACYCMQGLFHTRQPELGLVFSHCLFFYIKLHAPIK